jgi:regulation of enolase protein 1 (concanavalin A-like superfamily)
MKRINILFALALLTSGTLALAQASTGQSADVRVGGITFTKSINDAAKNTAATGKRLTLTAGAKQDNFRDPNGTISKNAPILLTRIDNSKPFTFSALVTPALSEVYDAGTLYVWSRDDLWLKMAMELDERLKARIVTVRTSGTSDDNNHDIVQSKSVYMKISSNTKTIGFYYSLDNKEWQLVRLYKNEYPSQLWLGVSAQSPTGKGTTVTFENMSMVDSSITDFRMGK